MKLLKTHSKPLTWLTASLFALLVAGCGGGGGGGDAAPATGSGTLGVSLTDSPACGFDNVYVTVNKVRVHQSSSAADTDAGWTDIVPNNAPLKIDLLSLTNGALQSLGETPLAAGHYTQLRLVLDKNGNTVVPTGGGAVALDTPSAVQSGIKLVNQFDVASGQRVDLLLDFDACKSIVKRGNGSYALKPVIKVIPFVVTGIHGFFDTTLLTSNVLVTAQQNGTIIRGTVPNANGEFFLYPLASGNYDVVLTADSRATGVIATVPVVTTPAVLDLNTSTTPITLPASATHVISGTETLNPALPADSTTAAYVTAKQTFGTAPTVTVKFVAADDSVTTLGAYMLRLPIGAPVYSQYVTGWVPSSLVANAATTAVAGKYTVEASATGYTTQSVSKDISTADATNVNFTLAP